MFKLKSGCTAVNFKNIEKTEDNLLWVLYGFPEDVDKEISRNQKLIDEGFDSGGVLEKQVKRLNALKSSPEYQKNELPRGIEKILIQVIESYTFWHSINLSNSDSFVTKDNYFHNVMNTSIIYMLSCDIAKLFNKYEDDFSLHNIWDEASKEIEKSSITSSEEIHHITKEFEANHNDKSPPIKKFINFRNKSVAHNKNTAGIGWSDFAYTIKFLMRVWGIVDVFYSPKCWPRPPQPEDVIFDPLISHFGSNKVIKMKEERRKLMQELFKSASQNLVTGESDFIKPFGELKISCEVNFVNVQ